MNSIESIETTAHTVEEALTMALEKLNLTKDDVTIEVLEESSKGFLGIFGGKMAKLKVTPKKSPVIGTQQFLEDVAQRMGLLVEIESSRRDNYIQMEFMGKDLGVLIGRRGDTLDALQYLANLVANKQNQAYNKGMERIRVILDAEGYRQRREKTLTKLAHKMADKVKKTGRKVVFEPMNPQERRIIHTALQEEECVQTSSEGADPFRRVIITEA